MHLGPRAHKFMVLVDIACVRLGFCCCCIVVVHKLLLLLVLLLLLMNSLRIEQPFFHCVSRWVRLWTCSNVLRQRCALVNLATARSGRLIAIQIRMVMRLVGDGLLFKSRIGFSHLLCAARYLFLLERSCRPAMVSCCSLHPTRLTLLLNLRSRRLRC